MLRKTNIDKKYVYILLLLISIYLVINISMHDMSFMRTILSKDIDTDMNIVAIFIRSIISDILSGSTAVAFLVAHLKNRWSEPLAVNLTVNPQKIAPTQLKVIYSIVMLLGFMLTSELTFGIVLVYLLYSLTTLPMNILGSLFYLAALIAIISAWLTWIFTLSNQKIPLFMRVMFNIWIGFGTFVCIIISIFLPPYLFMLGGKAAYLMVFGSTASGIILFFLMVYGSAASGIISLICCNKYLR